MAPSVWFSEDFVLNRRKELLDRALVPGVLSPGFRLVKKAHRAQPMQMYPLLRQHAASPQGQ